jgi:hypothetical protein
VRTELYPPHSASVHFDVQVVLSTGRTLRFGICSLGLELSNVVESENFFVKDLLSEHNRTMHVRLEPSLLTSNVQVTDVERRNRLFATRSFFLSFFTQNRSGFFDL